jgi:hypothetical protein
VALEVASHLDFDEVLLKAVTDRSETVRALLVPYLYRFWNKRQDAGLSPLHSTEYTAWYGPFRLRHALLVVER